MEFLVLLLSAALIATVASLLWRRIPRPGMASARSIAKEKQNEGDPYYTIEPLSEFDWESTDPIKIRPFKPEYHLTMGQ